MPPGLEVSLSLKRVPTVGESIVMFVMVRNNSSSSRVLMEHVNAQLKEYNRNAQESFWKSHKEECIKAGEVLKLEHSILPSEYESVLADDDIMNVAVVIKDLLTKERFLATQEFNVTSPKITVEIEGGGSIQMKKEYKAHVSFTNTCSNSVNGAVLTVEGSGLLQGKQESRMAILKQDEKIEKTVTIMAACPGTKLLKATFSHSKSPKAISRTFHKVTVVSA
ncbi:protein-glutamine gamma-glutamyltransferase Z-like [Notothenia coriiceps]|uniref:Protein-glutamine gamma-glutamyltransferase Z-like n=1 Tax=Notothenia coriiceps TaxID=8208 RepID=A0A6I9MWY2_9TELE|nr:PREDICTED: protein-glutamine gamma-glutamyltransferase Z-like [Notothenia coriiceps]